MQTQLKCLTIAGSAFDIGVALGQAGRAAMHGLVLRHPLWSQVTADANTQKVSRMAAGTQARFPRIWAEIEGLALGLDLPVMQVFAWNCRGDILATVPDGCTTLLCAGSSSVLAHNEDGFPFLRGHCLLAELHPHEEPAFTTFAYPGSLPGHSFAVTHSGLVQTVNNIRLAGIVPDIPRMVLGRAMLSARTLDQAIAPLRQGAMSGGFHIALAQAGDPRLLSVEFGGGAVSVRTVSGCLAHANHALHLPLLPGQQIITQSSADRQSRAEHLLASGVDQLSILRDSTGPGLPIRREAPDDPDEENTIATLLARVGAAKVEWTVHPHHGKPISGQIRQAGRPN